MFISQNDTHFDLTEAGLPAKDIALLYYADEPHMRAIFDAALRLDEKQRLTALMMLNLMFDSDEHRDDRGPHLRRVA